MRRIKTSGKLSYGPELGRPFDVRGRLAEWVYVGTLSLYRRFHIASSPYKTLGERIQTKRYNTPSYGNVCFNIHTKKVTVTKHNDESEGLPHPEGCEGGFLVAMEHHANEGYKKQQKHKLNLSSDEC